MAGPWDEYQSGSPSDEGQPSAADQGPWSDYKSLASGNDKSSMSDEQGPWSDYGGDNADGQGDQGPAARVSGPAPEGRVASALRAGAHAVIPGLVGLAGAGAGAILGAAGGSALPVVGTAAGGIAGAVGGAAAGGALGEKVEDEVLDALGINDREQRAANAQENYWSSTLGGLAGGLAGGAPKLAATVGERALSAGVGGAFEAGSQLIQGEFDPTQIALQAAGGAVLPGVNKLGAKAHAIGERAGARFVPGRPGRESNPAADQAHEDVGDDTPETAVGDSALAEMPPTPAGVTTGAPMDNKPTNSRGEVATGKPDGSYAKKPEASESGGVTTGDVDPATAAVLAADQQAAPAAQPETAPAPAQPEPMGQPSPAGLPNAAKPTLGLKPKQVEPVVDAGFPKEGEPVAMGENDVAPPQSLRELFEPADQSALSKLFKQPEQGELAKLFTPPPPEIKGRSAEPSEGQAVAGNYIKARSKDFGKDIAIETHAGEMRRSKASDPVQWENESPYEYGYFNKTKGPDGDHIDFARPKDGSPELGNEHFIIDQKDATTGKYDEPKVFTYYKDQDAALDAFKRGFSDGKGEDRLMGITKVSPDQVKAFLLKHTTKPPTGPYGKVEAKVAENKGRILVTGEDQPQKLGDQTRERKYGVSTGKSAGYPVEGLVNSEGNPVTANTKARAAERSAEHKKLQAWFEKSAPVEGESNGDLLNRIKLPEMGSWEPSHKPKEWMLAREARKVLSKPTPGNIDKFREQERLLRSGEEAADNVRATNRQEAEQAMSTRSGEAAMRDAENEAVPSGRNEVEEEMVENLDRRKEPRTEEASSEDRGRVKQITSAADLKRSKTIDVAESNLVKGVAKFELSDAALKRKQEAMALVKRKAPEKEVTAEGNKGKTIRTVDPEEVKRLIELSNKAAKKANLTPEEIDAADFTKMKPVKPSDHNTERNILRQFAKDEGGALNLAQMKAHLLNAVAHESYIAHDVGKEKHGQVVRDFSNSLHAIKQTDKAQRVALIKAVKELPAAADQAMLARIYRAREADSAKVDLPGKQTGKTNVESLDPADLKVFQDHIEPLLKDNDQFYDAIHQIDPDLLGPKLGDHISRITKGDTSEFNMLKDSGDPTQNTAGISVNATAAHERPFTVLERVIDGKRFVVQKTKNGYTLWNNKGRANIKDPNFEFQENGPHQVTVKSGATIDYIHRNATADEIERHALGGDKTPRPMNYYKNAMLSAVLTHAQMGSMARHIQELERIKQTPEFQANVTKNFKFADKMGYVTTKLPNMRGWYMPKEFAAVFDDYAQPGFGQTPEGLRNLNTQLTKLMFWNPIPHAANVGVHWFVGRGFDNLNLPETFKGTFDAMKSVYNQDARQKELLEAGAGLVYPSVKTQKFIEQIAQGVGEDFVKNPGKYPALEKLALPVKALSDAIYKTSAKMMWAVNDGFLTQRINELQGKGMSLKQAIASAERDIPNYRIPPTVMGHRALSQLMQDNSLLLFGRYHYGLMNSLANMSKDLAAPGSTMDQRVEAVGKFMALGVLMGVVYPVLDKIAKYATGNDEAEQARRGPTGPISKLGGALSGREDAGAPARSLMSLAPWLTTALESLSNHDWRGKDIVEKGDIQNGKYLKGAIQEGEHALRGTVPPYSQAAGALSRNNGKGFLGGVASGARDTLMDQTNPSNASVKFRANQEKYQNKDARQRTKKSGHGPLEALFNSVTE